MHTERIVYLQITPTSRKEHNGSYERHNRRIFWLVAVAHTYNPSTLGGPRWVDHKGRSSRPAWPMWWNLISTKNTKISWAWWWAPVVPATWEVEAGESLEPRRRRLQQAEITQLHSSLGSRGRLHLKQKQKAKQNKKLNIVLPYDPAIYSISKRTEKHMSTKKL